MRVHELLGDHLLKQIQLHLARFVGQGVQILAVEHGVKLDEVLVFVVGLVKGDEAAVEDGDHGGVAVQVEPRLKRFELRAKPGDFRLQRVDGFGRGALGRGGEQKQEGKNEGKQFFHGGNPPVMRFVCMRFG